MGKAKERYTLEEAANIIAQSDAAGSNQILQKLRQSVGEGELSAYFQGSHSPFVFDDAFITPRLTDLGELENAGKINELAPFARGFSQITIEFDQRLRYSVFPNNLEAYWDDLNKWLDINYARLPYRFPEPETPDTFAAAKVEGDGKPWLVHNPKDPKPEFDWYTPSRYFARKLVEADSTLLTKKDSLADKVATSLEGVGIYKRGKVKKKFLAGTILKSFVNVALN